MRGCHGVAVLKRATVLYNSAETPSALCGEQIEGCEARAMHGADKLLGSGRVRFVHMKFSPSNIKYVSNEARRRHFEF